MTMQKFVLEKIQALIEEFGLIYIDDRQWANTGIVRALQEDGTIVFHGYYNFQQDRVTIQFFDGKDEVTPTSGFTDPKCLLNHHSGYQADKLKPLYDWVSNAAEGVFT